MDERSSVKLACPASRPVQNSGATSSLFVGVSPHDPGIFAAAAGLFALVALLAASVPAFRTTRIDAVVALNST